MNSYRYAAYGSNLHLLRLQGRVPSASLLGTAFVAAWSLRFDKRSFTDGTGKCHIVQGGNGVHVAVFEIALSERADLDRYEGAGLGYDATVIDVPGFGDCRTYIADPEHIDNTLRPTDWYRELVVCGCRSHGFPDEYLQNIAAVATQPDPDEQRRRAHWKLVRQLQEAC